MARTFDTGLVLANRTVVRNRVAELLSPLLRKNGGFLRAIDKLDAPLEAYDDDGLQELFSLLLGRAPSIVIACGDRDVQPAGAAFRAMSFLEVHVYFVNNTPRSLIARAEGDVVSAGSPSHTPPIAADDTADPGIDVAMQCAEELLIGQRLDTATEGSVIKHLQLKRERPLRASKRAALWSQIYLVGVTRTINATRGLTKKMLGINTTIREADQPAESPSSTTETTELT